jgi:iron(III) transport system ATP-binding protein
MLEIAQVSKAYGPIKAVDRLTLSVAKGSRTVIVGASGSGKTTLLRLIAGFEVPDSGTITLGGVAVADGARAVPAHRRHIGYLPQDGALFPHLSVAANIGFGIPRGETDRGQRIEALADMVSLDRALLKRSPHELSGGQQQRVALARALAQSPRLMLLDEPFSALDTGLRAATRKAVARLLSENGVTTILVTHDQEEALSFADQIAVMRDGRLIRSGPPVDLYLRPGDETTALFLGDAVILPARLGGDGWAECQLGRIPVDDAKRQGPAHLMLRPEQLQLRASADGRSDVVCGGTVSEIDFTGHTCAVTVRQDAGGASIVVQGAVSQVPAVGSQVWIAVTQPAHVLGQS